MTEPPVPLPAPCSEASSLPDSSSRVMVSVTSVLMKLLLCDNPCTPPASVALTTTLSELSDSGLFLMSYLESLAETFFSMSSLPEASVCDTSTVIFAKQGFDWTV